MLKNETGRIPLLSIDEGTDEKTINQALAVANLPMAVGHVALMGDAHLGYGFPIGCVVGLNDAIIPYGIGNDLYCGVVAVRLLNVTEKELRSPDKGHGTIIQKIGGTIMRSVPLGFEKRKDALNIPFIDYVIDNKKGLPVAYKSIDLIGKQLGTLGGGNHFIECDVESSTGDIWLMVHSGSRGLGGEVCEEYWTAAKNLCKTWYSPVPKELAFLPVGSELFDLYSNERYACKLFAEKNRLLLLDYVIDAISKALDKDVKQDESSLIMTHHNFFELEHHFGRNLYVHRKGAVRVRKGDKAVIPGSMTTKSFIVEGLGNKTTLDSCSHGAGRAKSRKQAKAEFLVDDMIRDLDDKKIYLFTPNKTAVLDEWGPAYKDVDQVIEWQKDIVKPLHELKPIAVVKG